MAVSATKKLESPRCDFMASGSLDEPQRGARHGRLFKEQLFWWQLTGKLPRHAPGLGGQLAFYKHITQVG